MQIISIYYRVDIAEDVKRHFSEDGDDEYLEIALLDEQLQWPTLGV